MFYSPNPAFALTIFPFPDLHHHAQSDGPPQAQEARAPGSRGVPRSGNVEVADQRPGKSHPVHTSRELSHDQRLVEMRVPSAWTFKNVKPRKPVLHSTTGDEWGSGTSGLHVGLTAVCPVVPLMFLSMLSQGSWCLPIFVRVWRDAARLPCKRDHTPGLAKSGSGCCDNLS